MVYVTRRRINELDRGIYWTSSKGKTHDHHSFLILFIIIWRSGQTIDSNRAAARRPATNQSLNLHKNISQNSNFNSLAQKLFMSASSVYAYVYTYVEYSKPFGNIFAANW